MGQQMNDLRAQLMSVTDQLGFDGMEKGCARVANIAQDLGWGDLAHPTAFAVIYPFTGEDEASTRLYFYNIGIVLGRHALGTSVLHD